MIKSLHFVIVLGFLFSSCTHVLQIEEAYSQKVKPGNRGGEEKTEFIIVFDKKAKPTISIQEIVVYGYEGNDYHFSNVVESDVSMTRTLKSTENVSAFTVYLNSEKANKKMPSQASSYYAEVTYTEDGQERTVTVKNFEVKEGKQLRN